jgi:hypothetical protein
VLEEEQQSWKCAVFFFFCLFLCCGFLESFNFSCLHTVGVWSLCVLVGNPRFVGVDVECLLKSVWRCMLKSL